jgi:hypothetical protein
MDVDPHGELTKELCMHIHFLVTCSRLLFLDLRVFGSGYTGKTNNFDGSG